MEKYKRNRLGRKDYMDIKEFWSAVLKQDADKLKTFFKETAYVNWHCTNENFTVDEFIQANCEYPGEWDGTTVEVGQEDWGGYKRVKTIRNKLTVCVM
jgi:hypothetical protein